MSVACVWSVCAPVWLILATPSRRSTSPLNGPTPDATPLWDDVILRGLVRPAPRTDPRRNTPCGGDVILRGPCRSDSSRASPSKPSLTSRFPWAGAQLIQWRRPRVHRFVFTNTRLWVNFLNGKSGQASALALMGCPAFALGLAFHPASRRSSSSGCNVLAARSTV